MAVEETDLIALMVWFPCKYSLVVFFFLRVGGISTALTNGNAVSAAQSGTSTSFGNTFTDARKGPFEATAGIQSGTTASGFNVAGNTNSATFAQVAAPGENVLHGRDT